MFRSNLTKGVDVELLEFKVNFPQMFACIAYLDSLVWDLGKIAAASYATPRQISIGSYGSRRNTVKFTSQDLKDRRLYMKDDTDGRTGPVVDFTQSKWFDCTDGGDNTVCGYIGDGGLGSRNVFNVSVNAIGADPGIYKSYITSTVGCS